MSVITSLQNISSFSRLNFDNAGQTARTTRVASAADNRADLLQARSRLVDVYLALKALSQDFDVNVNQLRLNLPDARSRSPLNIDLFESAARLRSAEEINSAPNSYSTKGPNWTGLSTAQMTIRGEYDGSNGSGQLFFEVRRAGVKGQDNLRIRVEDPQGNRIKNINIRANHDPDRVYSIDNGLYLTLGGGTLINRDNASLQLFENVGAAVRPDAALGGTRESDPNFQYYDSPNTLPAIVDGSFDINGETIAVSTSDTINTVVDRVNASDAGVTAAFNPATEAIEFTQNTIGSAPDINITNDSSNFTVATKLASATVVPGVDSESDRPLADVAQFAGTQAGTFKVNRKDIAIDPSTDSLETVIGKINGANAGVTATFDTNSQRVTIEADANRERLRLRSNGTGLFDALNMPEGRLDPDGLRRGISRQRSYRVAEAFENFSTALNTIFNDSSFSDGGATISGTRIAFASLIGGALGADSGTSDAYGIRLNDSTSAQTKGAALEFDLVQFARSLQSRGDAVKSLLGGDGDRRGLISGLLSVTLNTLNNISNQLGRVGIAVDTVA